MNKDNSVQLSEVYDYDFKEKSFGLDKKLYFHSTPGNPRDFTLYTYTNDKK